MTSLGTNLFGNIFFPLKEQKILLQEVDESEGKRLVNLGILVLLLDVAQILDLNF